MAGGGSTRQDTDRVKQVYVALSCCFETLGGRKKHCQQRQRLENVFFTQSIKAIIRLKALLIKSNFVCEKSRQHLFFKQPIE